MVFFRTLLLGFTLQLGMAGAETVVPIHPIVVASTNGSYLTKIHMSDLDEAFGIVYGIDADDQFSILSRFRLKNGEMPKSAFLSDSGNLVTLDSWYSYGTGETVLVVYSPRGNVIKHYSLYDLYDDQDTDRFVETSSSVHWRCTEIAPNIYSGSVMHVYDRIGGELIVDMVTGEHQYKANSDFSCPSFP